MNKLLKRPRRVDSNQPEIVATFRNLGCSVFHLHEIGKGVPDICVGLQTHKYGKLNILVEIKDGSKPPSKRRLTPDEKQFHNDWQGLVVVISCPDDAKELITHLRGC